MVQMDVRSPKTCMPGYVCAPYKMGRTVCLLVCFLHQLQIQGVCIFWFLSTVHVHVGARI